MKNIEILIINNNNITHEGARLIITLKQLVELDISCNKIGVQGAQFISEYL
jgi:hypothetical protein